VKDDGVTNSLFWECRLNNGYVDDIPVSDVGRFESELLQYMASNNPEVAESIKKEKKITSENEEVLKTAIKNFKQTFASSEAR
jgi:F0F1-type ATP synthase, alpha subunit